MSQSTKHIINVFLLQKQQIYFLCLYITLSSNLKNHTINLEVCINLITNQIPNSLKNLNNITIKKAGLNKCNLSSLVK